MEWERYELVRSANGLKYSFCSEGPRGRIRKGIAFQLISGVGSSTFNLVFGDLEEGTNRIDDGSVSNNNDRQKVLYTVAASVIDFLKFRPSAIILIKPNALPRARLYQMMISSLGLDMSEKYEIYGRRAGQYVPFRKGLNYEEFIVLKKMM